MLNRTRKGMTLLELIVVIVILGILAAIAIPTFEAVIGKANDQSAVTAGHALDDDAMALAAFTVASGEVSPASQEATAAGESTAGVTDGTVSGTFTVTVGNGHACWTPSASTASVVQGTVVAGACA